jgi:putative transposase
MRWIQNVYTRRFNHRHKLWGHVFGGRYKAVLVESDLDSDYFGNLWDYIHLNPVRTGLVDPKAGIALSDYRWSSLAQVYAVNPARRQHGAPRSNLSPRLAAKIPSLGGKN